MSIAPRENIPLPALRAFYSPSLLYVPFNVLLAMLGRDGSSTFVEFQSILTHIGLLWGPLGASRCLSEAPCLPAGLLCFCDHYIAARAWRLAKNS